MDFDNVTLTQLENIIGNSVQNGLLFDWPAMAKKWKKRWEFATLDNAPLLAYHIERIGWLTAKKDIYKAWREVYPTNRELWGELTLGMFIAMFARNDFACMALRVNLATQAVSFLLTNNQGKQIGVFIGLRFPRRQELLSTYGDVLLRERQITYPGDVNPDFTVASAIEACVAAAKSGVDAREQREIQLHT